MKALITIENKAWKEISELLDSAFSMCNPHKYLEYKRF